MLNGISTIPTLSPLVSYGQTPLLIAISLFALVAVWYFVVYFSTRKKPQKTLATLPTAAAQPRNINELKQTYLHEIEVISTHYGNHTLTARAVHQQLSRCLREFVAKANTIPTDKMTLSDLQKINLPTLTPVIESYYEPEFSAVEKGSVQTAITTAKGVISSWS